MKCRKMKQAYGYLLAAAVALSGMAIMHTQAAGMIDLKKTCSLTVSVQLDETEEGNKEYLEDLKEMSIPVSVYRVANVDETGRKFTGEGKFAGMDFSKVGPDTTAADWESLAEQAKALAENQMTETEDPEEDGGDVTELKLGTVPVTVDELKPGLYLVLPETSYNQEHSREYSFAPSLAALPSSDYTLEGTGSDEWNYNITMGLKLSVEPLLGKLNITKNLKNYNATLGKATFVFQIVGKNENGAIKYEEVESLTFSEPGSQTITLEGIPAGLTVTVTEIYSGASYQVEGSNEAVDVIVSDQEVSLGNRTEASVEFTNSYDGGNRGGYGVTNHFESEGDGGWTWENPTAGFQE